MKKLKFFHIALFYRESLEPYKTKYQADADTKSFQEFWDILHADAFMAAHMFSRDLPTLGYECFVATANDNLSQFAWQRENEPNLPIDDNPKRPAPGAYGNFLEPGLVEILVRQVDWFKPDVLHIQDSAAFDDRFLAMLKHKPRLVTNWRAAEFDSRAKWNQTDIFFSNFDLCLKNAARYGARWQEMLNPGFDPNILNYTDKISHSHDVCFSGTLGRQHLKRIQLLEKLAQTAQRDSSPISLAYHIDQASFLPASVQSLALGRKWGMEMYSALKHGKICLNIHGDVVGVAANMRLFETTGVGSFCLTDFKPNIEELFIPGKEIETFKDSEEMLDKIRYFLKHDAERNKIAQAGQKKTLMHFSRMNSARVLDKAVRLALEKKGQPDSYIDTCKKHIRKVLRIPNPISKQFVIQT